MVDHLAREASLKHSNNYDANRDDLDFESLQSFRFYALFVPTILFYFSLGSIVLVWKPNCTVNDAKRLKFASAADWKRRSHEKPY